ncbi:hypothetical protein [uncultured Sphingopyxis sp.]|uniref:hypothetical protein n=1 Tax=uncultured Sphingopyxis sp. TaxID=310581 RepID=UPI0025DFA88B|nr:hypothetical protein [uncultured Sphingopyxis sp.]
MLEDEQIALARYAAATNPSAIDRYGRMIEGIGRRLTAFPYQHRPYFPLNRLRTQTAR